MGGECKVARLATRATYCCVPRAGPSERRRRLCNDPKQRALGQEGRRLWDVPRFRYRSNMTSRSKGGKRVPSPHKRLKTQCCRKSPSNMLSRLRKGHAISVPIVANSVSNIYSDRCMEE
jgi:hypothetical protein